jgi:hypothetical protein
MFFDISIDIISKTGILSTSVLRAGPSLGRCRHSLKVIRGKIPESIDARLFGNAPISGPPDIAGEEIYIAAQDTQYTFSDFSTFPY